jgi:hypothetical protein
VVAAERLRELRGLAVADAARDRGHRAAAVEAVGGVSHAHLGQVGAERRVRHLLEDALQLPARGPDRAGHLVDGQRLREAALHLGLRVTQDLGAAGVCLGSSFVTVLRHAPYSTHCDGNFHPGI